MHTTNCLLKCESVFKYLHCRLERLRVFFEKFSSNKLYRDLSTPPAKYFTSNSSIKSEIFEISVLKLFKCSLKGSLGLCRIIISEAVILPPFLLLKNLVRNFPFRLDHEVMDHGGRLLNHQRVVPFKQVEMKLTSCQLRMPI